MSQPTPSEPAPAAPSKLNALLAERQALLEALESDPTYVDPHLTEIDANSRTAEGDELPSHYTDPDQIQADIVDDRPVTTEEVDTEQPVVSAVDKLALWLKEQNPDWTLEQSVKAAQAAHGKSEESAAPQAEQPTSPNLEQLEARRAELKAARKQARTELNFEELEAIEEELEDLTENLMPAARQAEQAATSALTQQFEQSGQQVRDLYPEATNADSALYKRMEEIDADLEANDDPLFLSPDKPLRIAQMAARELNIAPKAKAGPAARPQAARQPHMTAPLKPSAVRAAAPNPTNQIQDEISAIRTPEQYEAMRRKLAGV